jgi:hypothetical protein
VMREQGHAWLQNSSAPGSNFMLRSGMRTWTSPVKTGEKAILASQVR